MIRIFIYNNKILRPEREREREREREKIRERKTEKTSD
jgi:hypothetical protein